MTHLRNIYFEHTDYQEIDDIKFTPKGWKDPIPAYTAWQCQELRRVTPEKSVRAKPRHLRTSTDS